MEQGSGGEGARRMKVETREKRGVPTRPLWGRADLESPPPLASRSRWSTRTPSPPPPTGTAFGGALARVAGGAERLAVGHVVREVGAQDQAEDVVDLRGGLDDAVAPAVLAERLARQLERAEVLPALRAVDARGEREGRVTPTPALVVLAVSLPAATGAAEELGVRGRTRGHGQGSRPPCATQRSYHYINWPHTEVRTRGLHNCCLSAWHRVGDVSD